MKKLEINQLENIFGGTCTKSDNVVISVVKDVSCIVAAGFWPIGTLIAGPACVGMIVASAVCAS